MNKKYQITIVRPGGNDQLLVKGIVAKKYKREINDSMIDKFPNVEQVSFYSFDKKANLAKLELAGGEFCGNATRSLAYLLLAGKKGQLSLKVSGTKQVLRGGVKKKGTAFAQMPIFSSLESARKISDNLFRVDLQGIIHLIYDLPVNNLSDKQLKKFAKKILTKQDLLFSSPAAGVMFVEEKDNEIILKPVVWVRDIDTLLYETACASGTTAVGLWLAIKNNVMTVKKKIQQPTGKYISIFVKRNKSKFIEAVIDGETEILQKEAVYE